MKKIFFLTVVIVSSLILTGCKSPTYDAQNPNELNTYFYGVTENSSVFNVSEKDTGKFDSFETKEKNENYSIDVKILDKTYVGVYSVTAQLPCSDTVVDVYKLQGTKKGTVFIDRDNNQIVEYTAIPYDEQLVTENDYIEFIKRIVGNDFDTSEYEYKCSTSYYNYDPNNLGSDTVDGFKICDENERIGSYSFFYTKYINDIRLEEHISSCFYDGEFNLEVCKTNYSDDKFSDILTRMSEIEEKVRNHLQNNVKEGCDILDIKHVTKQVFIKDGKPYILISSTVTYKNQYSEMPHEIRIRTITG